ncbi:MAG: hypothetical protein ACYS8I_16155, partial [Planctomycetota bacterium]
QQQTVDIRAIPVQEGASSTFSGRHTIAGTCTHRAGSEPLLPRQQVTAEQTEKDPAIRAGSFSVLSREFIVHRLRTMNYELS